MAMRALRSLLMSPLSHHHSAWIHSRTLSAQASSSPAVGAEGKEAKKRRRKRKNFVEVAQFLPDWGIGAKFCKSHWPSGNFYRITNVKIYKSGRHGAAWGIFHQDEAPKTGETQKIGGVNKRCWRFVPEGEPTVEWKRIASLSCAPRKVTSVDSAAPSTETSTT